MGICWVVECECQIDCVCLRVCVLHNHVFYTISTHEFFCTKRLRSNSLHTSSTSSLLLLLDNHKITDPQITSHISQKTIFSMEGQITKRLVPLHGSSRRGAPPPPSSSGGLDTAAEELERGGGAHLRRGAPWPSTTATRTSSSSSSRSHSTWRRARRRSGEELEL